MIHPLLILFLYYMVAHQAVPVYTKEPTLFVILNQDAFTYLGAWSQIAGCRDDNLHEFHWLLIICKMLHIISLIAIYLIRENIFSDQMENDWWGSVQSHGNSSYE